MKLLDTNICSAIIERHPKAFTSFAESSPDEIYVPTIVQAELYFGAFNGNREEKSLLEIEGLLSNLHLIEFSPQAAKIYGQLRARLRKEGKPIGPNDFIIAATALAGGFTLVTNNTQEFSQIEGLRLEDWLG